MTTFHPYPFCFYCTGDWILTLMLTHKYDTNFDHNSTENQVAEGLDFILSHFNNPIWPRTISTKYLKVGRLQYTVN